MFISPLLYLNPRFPAAITKAASQQIYYTIHFLADRERVTDAYHAYAYFRWVDDWLDARTANKSDCIAFVERQQHLMNCAYAYREDWPRSLTVEEQMLMMLLANSWGC